MEDKNLLYNYKNLLYTNTKSRFNEIGSSTVTRNRMFRTRLVITILIGPLITFNRHFKQLGPIRIITCIYTYLF